MLTERIRKLLGKKLHCRDGHPLYIVKNRIYDFLDRNKLALGTKWRKFDELSPKVSTEDNFDRLLIPAMHPSRRETDVMYVDEYYVLRTHTSAHLTFLMQQQLNQFLVTGDVYRKDHVDRWHYPAFHQMEGVCINEDTLHETICELIEHLFPGKEYHKVSSHYSYTEPSYEYEIKHHDRWIEVIGCGVIRPEIMQSCGRGGDKAWAFGIGLERIAMLLYAIYDIRWFWNDIHKKIDDKGKFCAVAPHCVTRSIGFSTNAGFDHNAFCFFVWDMVGDQIENIRNIEQKAYTLEKGYRKYALEYSAVDRNLTESEVTIAHGRVYNNIEKALDVSIVI